MSSKFIIFVPITEGHAPPEFELGEHDWANRPVLFRLGEAADARVAFAKEPAAEDERLRIKALLAPFVEGTEFIGITFHDLSDPADFAGEARYKAGKYSRREEDRIYPHATAAARAETAKALEQAVSKLALRLTPQVSDLALEFLLIRLPDYLAGKGRDASAPDSREFAATLRFAKPDCSSRELQRTADEVRRAFVAVGSATEPQGTRAAYAELKRQLMDLMA